jgi:hypothetical protein
MTFFYRVVFPLARIIIFRNILINLNHFFFQIVRPINAFLVVDVQNDFISGSLNISNCGAQHNGLEVSNIFFQLFWKVVKPSVWDGCGTRMPHLKRFCKLKVYFYCHFTNNKARIFRTKLNTSYTTFDMYVKTTFSNCIQLLSSPTFCHDRLNVYFFPLFYSQIHP